MPETLVQYGANQKFQARRHSFYDAAQDSYSRPPAQNPELFMQLTNVLPTSIEGILKKRWGYQLWSADSQPDFTHLFDYQRDADLARRIIATAKDAVAAYNENGTSYNSSIFTPTTPPEAPFMLNSRDYAFFADGVQADLIKWDGSASNGTSKWGIAAPTTAITVGAPSGGGAQTYTLSAAANHSGANTTYTGVGLDSLFTSTSVTVQGFTTSANNGNFSVVSSTSTTVVLDNGSGVAETNPATLVTQNQIRPTTGTNGWGANAHVGAYEGGVDQGFTFGLDGGTTSAYANPGNAFDGDLDSYASGGDQHNHSYGGCVWTFSTQSINSVNINLAVMSEVPASGTDGQIVTKRSAGIWYTIDSGATWTMIYNSSSRPKQYDIVSLPDGQDMGKVQVMAFYDSHDDMYHKVYDIYIEGTATGSGPLTLDSGRQYYLAFENSTAQNYSDISPVSTSTGQLFGAAIPLSNLEVSSDPQVDKKIILATADGGDPSILYLLAELDNATTTYIDSTAELTLLAANVYAFTDTAGNDFGLFENDPPPNAHFPTKHRGRVFMTDGENLYFSKNLAEVITPTGVVAGRYEEDWPPGNQLDISAGAEVARGLLSDGDFLYIGTDKRVLRLNGDGPDNFSPPQGAFANGGVNNQESWIKIFLDGNPLGCMWLTPDFRIIASDFNNSKDVGTPVQDILNTINTSAEHGPHAAYIQLGAYNLAIFAVPTGVSDEPDTLLVYDLKMQRWYTWKFHDNPTAFLYFITFAGIPQAIFWTGGGGEDYRGEIINTTKTTDGESNTAIVSTAQTSWLAFDDPTLRKVLNWMQVVTGDVT